MTMPWRLSDHQYVEKIKRTLKWHRRAGLFLLVSGTVQIAFAMYFMHALETVRSVFEDHPGEGSVDLGAAIGFLIGQTSFFAGLGLLAGIYWLCAGRKDRLLVDYHRRLTELGELQSDDAD
jgi:hypothetical protein